MLKKLSDIFGPIITGLSVLINSLIPGRLWYESLSARCYRCQYRPSFAFGKLLVDRLFWFEPEHCKNAYLRELKKGIQHGDSGK